MLRKWSRGIALFALLALIGCVPSLHPIYTDKDCVFDPDLVGLWEGEGETWAFTQRDDKSYNLVQTDKEGLKGNFVAHLVKLQGVTFLDLFPGEMEADVEINRLWASNIVGCHTFARVDSVKPDLCMAFTDWDWANKFLTENPAALKHEMAVEASDGDKLPVLTASTAELQKFWVEHARTEGAFGETMELKRQTPPAAPKDAPEEPPKEGTK